MKLQDILLFICIFVLVDSETIHLPEPRKEGGLPVNEVLSLRQTNRSLTGSLTDQELSQLLWAAYGINRPENGYKTVPSSKATFPFDLYVFLKTGIYRYDPKAHELIAISSEDKRAETGGDAYVKNAFANICLDGKYDRIGHIQKIDVKQASIRLDAGFINEAMYYVAAAEGFHAVTRGGINIKKIVELLGFTLETDYVPMCFSVGR